MAFVSIYHPVLEATALVGARAVPGKLAKGWRLTDEAPHPTLPFDGDSAGDNPVPVGDDTTPNLEDENS